MTGAVATKSIGIAEEAIPSPETLIERARAMIPVLRERARACTLAHNVPDETVSEMKAAGFFRVLQPKRWGGYEMHPNVFFEVQKALAEGCMSTGWIYGVLGCHPYELALFHDEAQREVWADNPDMLVSSTYQPVGKVEKAEGGFYLSGRWGFSSGSTHCGWVLLGAINFDTDGGPPDMRTFLLPRSDYQVIEGTWDTFGLQGTGSFDIVVDRVFVPDYRTHRAIDGFHCANPGQKENDGPLYRLPWAQVFMRSVSTAAFGGIRAATQAALDIMASRVSTNTGKAAKADPVLHAAIARAIAETSEMEMTHRATFDELMEYAERGEDIPMARRGMFAYQSASVVRRMADLADDMMKLMGGRAIYMSSAIIQPWLDLNAARAHVANDPANRTSDLIGTMQGEAPSFTFL
ncbi:3-hydroxy-9,10-secoandrosta-1,3,5(10)-triene-9,17-dione monooxygenase [Sphingobium sp. OAS761]|uniref:acyl-CoA dehydrogenase family protein n=1 Tax=Sphingobium sp. OAS761 TaxID=2817901 RepID=UPI00209D4279|nr:acyl-CoA dehydrogenase family protein [Sphingobium sp. OAS761]MCP1471737.1 3-hydroxy-9,10-secoandrosta-1,3,5(10)-triene-9,17-dione monooxygenase [Sphingobium sp. OAS761]